MPLADGSRVIAVALKNLCDGRGAHWPVGAIARPATDQLANRTKSHCVMISPRKQRCTCGGTKSCDVESIVTKSLGRQLVIRRRRDGPAERGWITEAGIINQNEQDIRYVGWRIYWLSKVRDRALQGTLGHTLKRLWWTR